LGEKNKSQLVSIQFFFSHNRHEQKGQTESINQQWPGHPTGPDETRELENFFYLFAASSIFHRKELIVRNRRIISRLQNFSLISNNISSLSLVESFILLVLRLHRMLLKS
jgi:hypothetical protein